MSRNVLIVTAVLAFGAMSLFLVPFGPDPAPVTPLETDPPPPVAEFRLDSMLSLLPGAASEQNAPASPTDRALAEAGASRRVALEEAQRGMELLRAGEPGQALPMLERAYEAGIGGVSLPLAVAYRDLGRTGEAIVSARRASEEEAQRADPWVLLGQLYLDTDQLEGAVAAWEKALELRPGDANLRASLQRARADLEVQKRFFVGETQHFRVRFEGPAESRVAQRVLDDLERAYSKVGRTLGYYPEAMIETILYTEQAFFDVTRSPRWSGGVFDGKVRLPVSGADADLSRLEQVVTHEYVHAALTHMVGGQALPAWVHEGLAMNLERGDSGAWARAVVTTGGAVSLNDLRDSFTGLSQSEADRAYATSYLVVHSLLERFGPFRMADFVRALKRQPVADAFHTVYRESPGEAVHRALSDYTGSG